VSNDLRSRVSFRVKVGVSFKAVGKVIVVVVRIVSCTLSVQCWQPINRLAIHGLDAESV